VEGLLVGLADEFGDAVYPFFTDAEIFRALTDRFRPPAVRDSYARYLPALPADSSEVGCTPVVGFAGLTKSPEYDDLMHAVVRDMDTPPPKRLSLEGFMHIFAQSAAAKRLRREYNLQFR